MSIASQGSSSSNANNNDQELTDLQINALLSSTLNSPNVSHNKSISGASTNVDSNDIDMALFNLLSNDTTIVEDNEQRQIKKESITPTTMMKKESTNLPSAVTKKDTKLIKQEFSTKPINDEEDDDDSSRISLYARLDFPTFTFYVQTLQVLLGRKIDDGNDNSVDVHLGSTKAISRRHGKIFYNFGTQRFELSILGRNGAFVDESFVETGVTLPLKNNTKIQIGEIPFQFVLPTPGSNLKKSSTRINPSDAISLKSSLYNNNNNNNNNNNSNNNNNNNNNNSGNGFPDKVARKGSETEVDQSKDKKLKEKPTKKVKQPKKVYTLEEIPEQYRTKPSCSYSHLIAVCLKDRSTERGMSLSEIYKGIQDLYPYYHYCPDGWQSSVRHNLSLNKSFKKVSKEGKGWLWGLDEEFYAEKEKINNNMKKTILPPVQQKLPPSINRPLPPQSSLSTLKNNGSPPPSSVSTIPGRIPQTQSGKPITSSPSLNNKSIAQIASEIKRPINTPTKSTSIPSIPTNQAYSSTKPNINTSTSSIQAQLAANRALPKTAPSAVSKTSSVPGTNVIKPGLTASPVSAQSTQQQLQQSATLTPTATSWSPKPAGSSSTPSPAPATPNSSKLSGDTMKALNYLQQELIRLTKDRKGLDKKTTTQILTQALAMTISQVNQAAKNSGMTGNPLVLLIDKNPQHLTKILTAALNAATYQVTKGKVKPGMVNNNVSSSATTSSSNTPTRQPSIPTTTAPPPKVNKPETSSNSSSSMNNNNNSVNITVNRPYSSLAAQPVSTKPPINDKFRPPHVTNPMPQQISRPATKPVSIQRHTAPLPQSAQPISTLSPQSTTPKPKAFSKPSAYSPRPSPSSQPLTGALPKSGNMATSLLPQNAPMKSKITKPSSYTTPLQRVSNTGESLNPISKPVTPNNELKQGSLVDADPLNDPEFNRVLESFSRQASPALDENLNSEPVDLDKLLAEDGYDNDTTLNLDRGVKRELDVNESYELQHQNKVHKTE